MRIAFPLPTASRNSVSQEISPKRSRITNTSTSASATVRAELRRKSARGWLRYEMVPDW